VRFAAVILGVASQGVFIIIVVYSSSTQSGNFWIHPRMLGWLRIGPMAGYVNTVMNLRFP
jgi:hypothetical protein